MTGNQLAAIERIICKFNFHKVLVAMQALDWKWVQEQSANYSVPTIAELKKEARDLLKRSIDSEVAATGGFQARYHPSVDGNSEWFELYFIVEEAESFDYD